MAYVFTGALVVGAAVSAIACAIAKLIIENEKSHSKFSIHTAVFVFFAGVAVQYAGAKHGGTNDPPRGGNVELRIENGELRNIPTPTGNGQIHHSPFSILHSQFPTGLVLAKVGTNETFSFSAPSDAIVQSEWLAFGAARMYKCRIESVKWRIAE